VKVALVTRFFLTGQTTHILNLASELVRQGLTAEVIFTHFPRSIYRGEYLEWLDRNGIGYKILSEFREPLLKALRRGDYDVIHAHSYLTFVDAVYAGIFLGLPVVLTCHSFINYPEAEWAFHRANAIIAVGDRVASTLTSHEDKLSVIGNGVDLNRFLPRPTECDILNPQQPVTVTYIGRQSKQNLPGLLALLGAVTQLVDEGQALRFQVLGAWDQVRPSATARKLGWVVDPAPYLAESDIVVGTGVGLREGMAATNACLVLGRKYGGLVCPERAVSVGVPNFSGWTGDDLRPPASAEIAKDLRQLIADRGRIHDLKVWSRGFAEERFDVGEMATRTADVYAQALGYGCIHDALGSTHHFS